MMSRYSVLAGLMGLALICGPITGVALAQSNDEIQTATQFNFSTPGARSLGLGGAFLALADDATAAFTNPAGLSQLARPEMSLEVRAWTYRSLYAEAGHTPDHELTGIGVDIIDGLADGEIEDRTEGLSFLSYVHTGRRWAVALYRHQLASFEATLEGQGPFVGTRESNTRINPVQSHLELDIVNFGLSGAYRVTDKLSLGVGVSHYDYTLDSLTDRFDVAPRTGNPLTDVLTGNHYGPADFRRDNLFSTQTQEGDDTDTAFTLGILWKITGRLSVGGVYRQGPELAFSAAFVTGPASPNPGEIDPELGGEGTFHVPDVYGVGLAYRISDAFVISFDYDRVEYSDMTDDLVNLLRVGREEPENYLAEDADEFHLGFEYLALRPKYPVAVRLGVWHDPDHRLHYVGERPIPQARFRSGDDEIHVAAGIGMATKRTQLDLAVELSDRVDTVSFSSVVRF